MWTTIALLGLALNFEPIRIGLVPILLGRERPAWQLGAFLAGANSMSLTVGLFTVTTASRLLTAHSGLGAAVQVAVGALAVVIAAGMVVHRAFLRTPTTKIPSGDHLNGMASSRLEKHLAAVRRILGRGKSPWVAGMVGVGLGLPSVDYLAMLAVISTSGKELPEKYAGVVVFLILGSLVVLIPLMGCLLAPESALARAQQFRVWAMSRSVFEYAAVLFLAGLLMIGLGGRHLFLGG